VATWQADFHVVLATSGLPSDYRERLARVLPVAESWSPGIEAWGTETGDRIHVSTFDSGPQELRARFDLRQWRPTLYERFVAFVRDIGGRLVTAADGIEVALTPDAFMQSLGGSPAARFVRDPEAFLRALSANPIRMREEP
jgi:hypothetical protein